MIDFHCHLDLYPDPRNVARECAARGVYVLSVTNAPSAWSGTAAIAPEGSRIRTALGLHPQLATQRKGELALFRELLGKVRYVGEIGLDGTPDHKSSWTDQVAVFSEILRACAAVGGRVLSIHSRGAAQEVVELLDQSPNAGTPVLHWFSGTQGQLERAIAIGCWFSVGPSMLAGAKGRSLVRSMPRERVLPESDGPFAQFQGRAAVPWDSASVVERLAEVWDETSESVERRMLDSLRRLLI